MSAIDLAMSGGAGASGLLPRAPAGGAVCGCDKVAATMRPRQAAGACPAGPDGAEECSRGCSAVPAGQAKPVGEGFPFVFSPREGATENLLRPIGAGL